MRIRLAIPLLLVLLAGCSSTKKPEIISSKPADLVDFKPTAGMEIRWHRNVGYSVDYSSRPIGHPGEIRWRSIRGLGSMGSSVLQPVLTADAIYAASAKGKLLRLKPDDGSVVWRVNTGMNITGGVGTGAGMVLVGGEKGEVAAYDENGKLLWQTTVSSEVLGAPQVADGIVVVRSGDGRIAGLDAEDGKRKWLYERIMPALVVRSHAGVLIRNGTIFSGYAGGKLVAINLENGNAKWEATLSEPRGNTELERISDITSQPQTDGMEVCTVSFQGRVGCFDAAQGNLLWSRDMSSYQGLVMYGKVIYVTDAQGEVIALDKETGSSLWKNNQLFMRQTTVPLVTEHYLVVGDYEGYLHVINRDDGSMVARIRLDSSDIPAAPQEMDNGLLVQTYNGGLYSVALH